MDTGPMGLVPCRSGQCLRKVRPDADYCCSGCRVAWESEPRYDADGYHSDGCNDRAAERGMFTSAQAVTIRGLVRTSR